jgi:hypothetical protein
LALWRNAQHKSGRKNQYNKREDLMQNNGREQLFRNIVLDIFESGRLPVGVAQEINKALSKQGRLDLCLPVKMSGKQRLQILPADFRTKLTQITTKGTASIVEHMGNQGVIEISAAGYAPKIKGPGGWGFVMHCRPIREFFGGFHATTRKRVEMACFIVILQALDGIRKKVIINTDSPFLANVVIPNILEWENRKWRKFNHRFSRNGFHINISSLPMHGRMRNSFISKKI